MKKTTLVFLLGIALILVRSNIGIISFPERSSHNLDNGGSGTLEKEQLKVAINSFSDIDKNLEKNSEFDSKEIIKLYETFLSGEITSKGGDTIKSLTTLTGEPNRHYATKYAFYDANGDDLPELHIDSSRYYTIYTLKDGELVIWKQFMSSTYYYPLKNGAFMSWKPGAAPAHDDYGYHIYDFLGNEILKILFSRYDSDENQMYDESDEYHFYGVSVTKEQWDLFIEKYLITDADMIEGIRDEIDWNVLYEETN